MTAHSAEHNAERLLRLSDEVGQIAASLAGLTIEASISKKPITNPSDSTPGIPVERIRAMIRARRLRAEYFADELFADPAWDMMLYLLQAEASHRRVSVSSLCAAAAVPMTTALRWLKTMVDRGLFIRHSDPLDGRRIFVELAPGTSHSLRQYFAKVSGVSVA